MIIFIIIPIFPITQIFYIAKLFDKLGSMPNNTFNYLSDLSLI